MIEKININKIFSNPVNPRLIKEHKFKKLVKSIKEFPEMLKLRPIVVNKEYGILGGNMRYKACLELGLKDVWIIKAENLTKEQMEQFVIKDNVGFGEWDWDILANNWQPEELKDWGVDVWQPEEDVDYSILNELDLENTLEDKESNVKRAIMIEFEAQDYDEANELITKARKEGKNIGRTVLNAFKN